MKYFDLGRLSQWKVLKLIELVGNRLNLENLWRYRAVKKFRRKSGLPMLELADFFHNSSVTVNPIAFLGGGSMPTDLALIKLLLQKYKVENYLEIGTWRGESVANAASLVKKAYTVNLPDSTFKSRPFGSEYAGNLRQFSERLPNVVHIQADSTTFDFGTIGVKFGLVFIDGDHTYQAVKADTLNILNVLEPNGIIVWHDYTRHIDQVRWDVLNGILDGTPVIMHDRLFGVSNTLCAVYLPHCLGDFSPAHRVPFKRPSHYFTVDINVQSFG